MVLSATPRILEEITFQIEGHSFALPKELSGIAQAIEDSKYILSLANGWDEEKALPISKETWQCAVTFLLNYSQRVFSLFSLTIDTPDINPCPNGTIDISWRTKKARMLVNVRKADKGTMLAFFYGDLYDNLMPIKGNVPTDTVEDHLACWMKNLI